jgi:hypothetical protein
MFITAIFCFVLISVAVMPKNSLPLSQKSLYGQILRYCDIFSEKEQVSISPTFYARLFCTKVLREAFLYLYFRLELFFGARLLAQMRS